MDFDVTFKALDKGDFRRHQGGLLRHPPGGGAEEPQKKSPAEPKRTGLMVDSEGKEGEKNIWGKRVGVGGLFRRVKGEKVGIAILDYPQNPKHPTYWHSRSYGLFAANIFGEHDFYNDK